MQMEEQEEHASQLRFALCACVAELSRCDANALDVVQLNGIYVIAQLLMPRVGSPVPAGVGAEEKSHRNLQV